MRRLIPEQVSVETPSSLKKRGWSGYDWMPASVGIPVLDVLAEHRGAAGKIVSPVLLVQGTKDRVITRDSAGRAYEKIAAPDKELWLIQGGTHLLMQETGKEELFARSLAFLEKGIRQPSR